MSKITALQAIRNHLEICREVKAHTLLLHPALEPETRLARLALLSEYALVATELEDHIYNLSGMATACRHGLAGTVPDDYEPTSYGLHPPIPYNPYSVLAEHLSDEYRMPVLQLSPLLLAYIDALPEQERLGSAVLSANGYLPWQHDETGTFRQLTPDESTYEPERSFLRQLEKNFFTLTYPMELAQVPKLTAIRGEFQRILELVA